MYATVSYSANSVSWAPVTVSASPVHHGSICLNELRCTAGESNLGFISISATGDCDYAVIAYAADSVDTPVSIKVATQITGYCRARDIRE